MSKFTTEVKYICETYADISENTTFSINETINAAIPYIFDETWGTYNSEHKQELCAKILRHYYMREIGAETVGLWKLQINSLLSEIMPKYNVLYAQLESIKNNIMGNVNTTETRTLNNVQNTSAESANTDYSSSQNSTRSNAENRTNGNGTNSADGWQEYADTPQGALTGIENQTYLTNATRNRSTNDSSNAQNALSSSNSHTDTNNASTSSGKSTGVSNTDETYTLTITGKNSGSSFVDEYTKVVKDYNDVDAQIIKELNVCFMGLWE